MALNRLTTAEMVNLIKAWTQAGHPVRNALERSLGLAPLVPRVIEAYDALITAQRMGLTQTLTELSAAQTALDARHDSFARCINSVLDAYIHMALARGDVALARELGSLRDFLFPDGLRVITYSYREEAGQADLLASRMTQEHRNLLARIPMPGGTLLDIVNEWLRAGSALGELEDRRSDTQVPSRRKSMFDARAKWIRAIKAVRLMVEINRVEDPVIEEALNRIAVVEAAADRDAREVPEDELDPDSPDTGDEAADPIDDGAAELGRSEAFAAGTVA